MNPGFASWVRRKPAPLAASAAAARHRLMLGLALMGLIGLAAGLLTGAQGWSLAAWRPDAAGGLDGQLGLIVWEIRLPRTLGAAAVGALLGLGGALAQGVFRNPLADPFLLGSASGAGLAVVLVLVGAGWLAGPAIGAGAAGGPGLGGSAWWAFGTTLAAFCGALAGVMLTLLLARGAVQTLRLLLAGVVVGALLGAVADLLTVLHPDALRGRQAFALGSTSFLGWPAVAMLGAGLAVLLALALRHARALDALTLGEDTASSLGLPVARLRLRWVALLAAATALAVAQAGLVAFIGLVAPHLVRRRAPGHHRWLLPASAAMGAVLLVWADVLSRGLVAPLELPLGIVTAVLGGVYLCLLMWRGAAGRFASPGA